MTIPKGVHDMYPSLTSSMGDEILSLSEDQLSSTFKSRNEYEKKFSNKYQSTQSVFNVIVGFIANVLF